MACFQTTFRVSLQSVGTPPRGTCPWPVGPRNSGQFSARAAAAHSRTPATAASRPIRMTVGSDFRTPAIRFALDALHAGPSRVLIRARTDPDTFDPFLLRRAI